MCARYNGFTTDQVPERGLLSLWRGDTEWQCLENFAVCLFRLFYPPIERDHWLITEADRPISTTKC